MQTTLIATVKGAKPQFSEEQRKKLNKLFAEREGKLVQVAIGDIEKSRSGQQNKFLWGVVYALLADKTGYTAEEMHEICRYKFLPRKYLIIDGEEVEIRKSTTKLTTTEFEAYIERIRVFASSELQVVIPDPS